VPSKAKLTEDQKIIRQAMDDYDLAFTAESRNRIDMVDDLRFAALDQWPDDVKNERKNRPMLTLDHIGQSIRKVVGGIRQNMPSIKVDPIDDGADKETADILEDLTRQIEQESDARNAYINASKFQVKMGYGVWRVVTVENQDDIFKQDIRIIPVKNPFTCYGDPDAIQPQKQDGRFWLVSTTMSEARYKRDFGGEIPVSVDRQGLGESYERWYAPDSVRISEYFLKSKKKKSVTQLSNGVVLDSEDITEEQIAQYQAQGITPAKTRDVEVDVITWYKLSAFKILEKKEWPSKYFPIIPVYGEEENIEGEVEYRGIVRAAKDPQRMYNYWNSAAAETIALQPKAPWVVTKNQVKNYTEFWDSANTENLPYLPYEPDGNAPPPQRTQPPTMQNGLLQQAQTSAQDIEQATGVFEAAQQPTSENRSGRAVIALQQEANLGTSIYEDNLAGAIAHTGKVIIDMIPTYYDTQRVLRLRGEDDAVRFVEVNKAILTPDGKNIQHDLTRGKYDARAGVGRSYRTRRIEAAASMFELASVLPQVQQVGADLIAKNLDWPGADELAERLRKMLPPGIADDGDDLSPEELQAKQQAQQQQQALQDQAIQLEMADKQSTIENKQADTAVKQSTAVKNFSEIEQNDVENAIQTAELARAAGNAPLFNAAIADIARLLQNGGNPSLTAGAQQV
tara:strand:- start:909 stop:2951 length:2043 start_codon:yes stop_codon:yes gene_type:complete